MRKDRSGSRSSRRILAGNRCEEPLRSYRIGRARLHLFCVQSLKQFPRTALNPVAQQFPVLAHSPDRRAGEVDRPLIRGHAQYPIVFARDPPARRNAAAVLILECLHDLELKIGDPLQKLRHPIFGFVLRNNVDAARGNDESSTTNLSIASTSCGAFQTAAQKSSTILTEFICPLFTVLRFTLPAHDKPPATRRSATEIPFPLSIDSNCGLGNF
jgi:hypothetical protein